MSLWVNGLMGLWENGSGSCRYPSTHQPINPLTLFLLIALLFSFFPSCTEETPIAPAYRENADWITTLRLEGCNYQRFALWLNERPPLEIGRAIRKYDIELRRVGAAEFQAIDSIDTYYNRYFISYYESPPLLAQDREYEARLRFFFQDGSTRFSDTLSFYSPQVSGNVLQEVILPESLRYIYWYSYAVTEAEIYATDGFHIYRIEIATGAAEMLNAPLFRQYNDLHLLDNGRIVLTLLSRNGPPFTLQIDVFDPVTGTLDSLTVINTPGGHYAESYDFVGSQISIWAIVGVDRYQLFILDVNSGSVLTQSPELLFDPALAPLPLDFVVDGSRLWGSDYRKFDNRINRFDTNDWSAVQTFRNPLFRPRGLAWDGSNLWTFDWDGNRFVKLEVAELE
ncbi:MAG: hypothetical protein KDG51_22720 [Calditrichaeota bacterium]|nr:hypothetical protein [Calditrichota bacterium]